MKWFIVLSLLSASVSCAQQPAGPSTETATQPTTHPRLVMTPTDVQKIRSQRHQAPLFTTSLDAAKAEVDAEIALGIDTPIPRDYSGGYTHARHKKNYAVAQKAGALYQILGEAKYASYVRDMLFQYADMYGDLPLHPKPRSYARGKIFWQCLNDANWLVFMSQAYDAIYETLSKEERDTLESKLFRPFADHISVASPQFFNRIHNHSTWGTAAVGMIGLVMNDDALIQRALYGLDLDNFSDERDNDGGFIRQAGQQAGFFANLDSAFSPDGYYTEGPYYQRYAMYPYLVFAQSLSNAGYAEQAFARSNGVLLKAVETLIQLSDSDGEFFPLNDAQKGMSLQANELVTAVDIAYQASGDPRLLDIAQTQQRVLLDGAGYAVARDIAASKTVPFGKSSVAVTDGRTGTEGGLAILRAGNDNLELVFKYTSQGLSHGHYDKLSYSLYEQGHEVLQDYGMARFVNLGQKGGGNYLPENSTWAKQSIAHNALVINETSHFQGQYDIGSKHHSQLDFFDVQNPAVQVVSAIESNAYPGSSMRRTVALLNLSGSTSPVILDVLEVQSESNNQYDLPFHFLGQVVETNIELAPASPTTTLGKAHGYQHLIVEARGDVKGTAPGNTKFTWLNKGRFYTLTSTAEPADELIFTRLGANDASYNLRRDPALILRRNDTSDTVFASIVEPHGSYSPINELAIDAQSNIKQLQVELNTTDYMVISLTTMDDQKTRLYLAKNQESGMAHQLQINSTQVAWTGPFHLVQKVTP